MCKVHIIRIVYRLLNRCFASCRYLVSFWPNLSKVYAPSDDDDNIPSLNMLRFCIRTFQGLAETKLRIMQQYGEESIKFLLSSKLEDLYEEP